MCEAFIETKTAHDREKDRIKNILEVKGEDYPNKSKRDCKIAEGE